VVQDLILVDLVLGDQGRILAGPDPILEVLDPILAGLDPILAGLDPILVGLGLILAGLDPILAGLDLITMLGPVLTTQVVQVFERKCTSAT
jgi:hypothetical protein